MRAREIYEYIQDTPTNVNPVILKQMLDKYVERKTNPLYEYTVDTDIAADTDLLGKTIGDLQKNVRIVNGIVYGTLLYVTDYTGFSGLPEEQKGYFLALHFEYDGADSIKVNGATLDEDGIFICIIKNRNGKLTVEVTKDGETIKDTLLIKGLKYQ